MLVRQKLAIVGLHRRHGLVTRRRLFFERYISNVSNMYPCLLIDTMRLTPYENGSELVNLFLLPASFMLGRAADRGMHWWHASNVMLSVLGASVEYLAQ